MAVVLVQSLDEGVLFRVVGRTEKAVAFALAAMVSTGSLDVGSGVERGQWAGIVVLRAR